MKKLLWVLPVLLIMSAMYFFYQKTDGTNAQHGGDSMGKASAQATSKQHHLDEDYQDAITEARNSETSMEEAEGMEETSGIHPERLIIPSIQVDASVEQVGLTKDGQMEVPSSDEKTALYKNGPKPGEKGNAVIDGHVDNYKGPAVFFYLKDLKKGDKVYVQGKKGKKLTFEVVQKKSYPMNDAPLTDIFGYAGQPMLNLITCTGTFDHEKKTHLDRLVVYTKLVNS